MKCKMTISNSENKKIDCDVLIQFDFDGDKYIVYTDNTYNANGEFNLFRAKIDKDNKICDPTDTDVVLVFEKLISEYKNKVTTGEI